MARDLTPIRAKVELTHIITTFVEAVVWAPTTGYGPVLELCRDLEGSARGLRQQIEREMKPSFSASRINLKKEGKR